MDTEQSVALPMQAIPPDEYAIGKVTKILEEGTIENDGFKSDFQKLKVQILDGKSKGREIEIENGGFATLREDQKVKPGDEIIVSKVTDDQNTYYYVYDSNRTPSLWIIGTLFLFIVVLFGKKKGVSSLVGLIASVLIIIYLIIPLILSGQNPVLVSLGGSVLIAIISMYLAHGFNKQTSLSLISTLITLFISSIFSFLAVGMAKLNGTGTEESFYLQFGPLQNLNLQGLLLGGIIIGALGVLDDVTTSQTAAIQELKSANHRLSFKQLYQKGLNIGREHIASLVNTLFLAYAGASLPLFLIFSMNKDQPLWVILNSEYMAEEIVRTLIGSASLILAVPISTFLAAKFLKATDSSHQTHYHA